MLRPSDASARIPAAPTSIGATEARAKMAELIGRVAFAKERIVLTRNGQDMAVLVPVEDFERLQQWERAASERAASERAASESAASEGAP